MGENELKKKKDIQIDASMGYKDKKHIIENEENGKTILYKSVYFEQFQAWIRNVFDDDELYYRYLLMFMKSKIADMSWITHLQKLMRDTKAEKASIDRLMGLGFDKRESVEAYLACDKDEALAALFMSQNTETKGKNDENEVEEKKDIQIDASMGYKDKKHIIENEENGKTILYKSVYFEQFQAWIRNVFDDDELYYRYLLMFMKSKIADMSWI